MTEDIKKYYCSFCGKKNDDKVVLIAVGPSVYICDLCVELCNEIIEENRIKNKTPKDFHQKEKPIGTLQNVKPAYTFDSFVVGENNKFAHYTCYAVANMPAKKYNPLYIHGKYGLGKTHLMQAIIHNVQSINLSYVRSPKKGNFKVFYATSEKFTEELINAMCNDEMTTFRDRYRNCDIFILEDIQFLEGKERAQEELYYVFNYFPELGKQFIVTCDRKLHELSDFKENLINRLESSLVAEIKYPDIENIKAILKLKASNLKHNIPDDVQSFISSKCRNVREIEGSLLSLSAYAELMNCQINIDVAREVLGEKHNV